MATNDIGNIALHATAWALGCTMAKNTMVAILIQSGELGAMSKVTQGVAMRPWIPWWWAKPKNGEIAIRVHA